MHELADTPLDSAIAKLCNVAIFFCVRSCEYSKVPKQHEWKTKLLCLRTVRFFLNDVELEHSKMKIFKVDMVSIDFLEDKKNREKFDTINVDRASDPLLCPVRNWAKIVSWIESRIERSFTQ